MAKRYKMKNRNSKRKFRKGSGTNRMNTRPRTNRGGGRL